MARHIARVNRSFTLFATHYFELTHLAQEIEGIANVHLDATEHRDGIVFLHAVKEGPASRSYGLAVAQLAGVPREVIAAAPNTWRRWRHGHAHDSPAAGEFAARAGDAASGTHRRRSCRSSHRARRRPIHACSSSRRRYKAVNANDLTLRAALDLIYKLRSLLS